MDTSTYAVKVSAGQLVDGDSVYLSRDRIQDVAAPLEVHLTEPARAGAVARYADRTGLDIVGAHFPRIGGSERPARSGDLQEFLTAAAPMDLEYAEVHPPAASGGVALEEYVEELQEARESSAFEGELLVENVWIGTEGESLLRTVQDVERFGEVRRERNADRIGMVLDPNHARNPDAMLQAGADFLYNV
ncbi:MAG: hypothetical protein SVW02_02425, partial [Candidatus Nanohaloarchaea archaeon]|nr:hypothetical protein [Candidatus Nanohaloarchaea archaeon]